MAERYYKGHLICESGNHGYPTIWDGEANVLVHRLVWGEHHGKIPDGMEIHHKDFNKQNYSIENLELLTATEHHRRHALRHGLGKSNNGKAKNYQSGCVPAARQIIGEKDDKIRHFNSISEAARELNTNVDSVWRVLKGRRKQNHGWRFSYVNA